MKLAIKILRVAHVPADQLKAAVGADDKDNWASVMSKLKDSFGPISPVIRFFKRDEVMVIAGIEAISFDVEHNFPMAGFVNAEPLDKAKIHQLDGQLLGELARIGIHTMAEQYEWRCFYESKGN